MKILQRCRLHWGQVEEEPVARRVRVSRLTGQASSGTRSSTRLQAERGQGSHQRGESQQRTSDGEHSTSSLPLTGTSSNEGRGTGGPERDHPVQAEPQEEPPNQADLPGDRLQITLTGRRRRFAAEPTWQIWFAESSQCFHRRQDCRGLRNANRVRGHPVCGACQRAAQGQRSLMEASFVYEDQLGNHHTDARCRAVTGPMLEIRQCKVCGG